MVETKPNPALGMPNPAADPNAPARAAAVSESANRQREDHRAAAVKRVDDETKARTEAMEETARRQSEAKPTPTQRENDLAKLGALDIDDKEDDGSGPELLPVTRREAVSGGDQGRYRTRESTRK